MGVTNLNNVTVLMTSTLIMAALNLKCWNAGNQILTSFDSVDF